MNWELDFDLSEDKKGSTKNRRTSGSGNINNSASLDEILDSSINNPKTPPEIPLRTRKTGGWANEGSKTAKSKNSNIIEQERFQNENKSQEIEDDIPVIPDIDDIQNDSQNISEIKVLNVTVKESTYKELNNQFENFQSGQLNFGNLGDIDLLILTNKLYPEKDVQKCSEVWTMDSLFQDLSKI